MATVGLIGVPIVRQRGSAPFIVAGATDQPRKDLELILVEANPELEIVDLGEAFPRSCEGATLIMKSAYHELGLSTKKTVAESEADVVLAIGGNHVAALPFYHLPGNVVRADAHGDAYVLISQTARYVISGGTYMHFVKEMGLKTSGEVLNVGVKYTNAQSPNGGAFGKLVSIAQLLNHQKPPQTTFFDIDLDVLHESYRLPHGHSTSDLTAEDLSALITSLKPKVIGMFECVNMYGTIPEGIVLAHQNVFSPICKAIAELAIARAADAKNGANPQSHQQTLQASSAVYR